VEKLKELFRAVEALARVMRLKELAVLPDPEADLGADYQVGYVDSSNGPFLELIEGGYDIVAYYKDGKVGYRDEEVEEVAEEFLACERWEVVTPYQEIYPGVSVSVKTLVANLYGGPRGGSKGRSQSPLPIGRRGLDFREGENDRKKGA